MIATTLEIVSPMRVYRPQRRAPHLTPQLMNFSLRIEACVDLIWKQGRMSIDAVAAGLGVSYNMACVLLREGRRTGCLWMTKSKRKADGGTRRRHQLWELAG